MIISAYKLGMINQNKNEPIIKEITFQTLNQGFYSDISQKNTIIIKSSAEWANL